MGTENVTIDMRYRYRAGISATPSLGVRQSQRNDLQDILCTECRNSRSYSSARDAKVTVEVMVPPIKI